MITRRFKKAKNEDYGTYGWLMVGAPSSYVPVGGMGIAHDILEHKPHDKGTIEHELLALGAMLFIRGEGNYWSNLGNVNPPGKHVAGDLGFELAIKYDGVDRGIDDPGRTCKLEPHVEEWLEQAVKGARREVESHDLDPEKVKTFLTRSIGWIRRGYRMAMRRYRGVDAGSLAYLFTQIEKQVDRLLEDDAADYCEMVVRVDPRKGNVRIYLDESNLNDEYN